MKLLEETEIPQYSIVESQLKLLKNEKNEVRKLK